MPPLEILPEIFPHAHVLLFLFSDTQHGNCHRKRGVLHEDNLGYRSQLPGSMPGCSVISCGQADYLHSLHQIRIKGVWWLISGT